MECDYQRMHAEERIRHHDELRDEGYEWCPECGEVLVWDLPAPSKKQASIGGVPVVYGDCPPLTRDQLVTTTPPVN